MFRGTYFGTNAGRVWALGNAYSGVYVGGTSEDDRRNDRGGQNVISGNGTAGTAQAITWQLATTSSRGITSAPM